MPKGPSTAQAGKKTMQAATKDPSARKVLYDKPHVKVFAGAESLTAATAKALLGWQEEEGKTKFADNYVREIKALCGRKVRLQHNVTNRPLTAGNISNLMQEILRGRWQLNLENRVIGKTGLILNGQHTLIALILAVEKWLKDPASYPAWKTEPMIETSIGYGAEETDAVANTYDTAKPRSLWEVICRSPYFADSHVRERRRMSRMADYAVKLLWHRTGAAINAFAWRRTHSESLDFIARHPRLLECVKHVYEENGEKDRLSTFTSPGYLAGLMYLMGSSTTDPEAYRKAENPHEELLDWSRWSKACDFVVLLAAGGAQVKPLRAALAQLMEYDGHVSNAERWALICNAWHPYAAEEPITAADLQLEYQTLEGGGRKLQECPITGGIDLGDTQADEEKIPAADPTPQQITERAAKERKQRKSKLPHLRPAKAGNAWAADDVAWVNDHDGDHYLGMLLEDPYACEDGHQRVEVRPAEGGAWEVEVAQLSLTRPPAQATRSKGPKVKQARSNGSTAFAVGDLVWVAATDKEPWQGRIVELLGGSNARLRVEQGHQGAGNLVAVAKHLLRAAQPAMVG